MNKRIRMLFGVVCLFLTGAPAWAAPIAGDVDGSGAVNAIDVQLVINGALGIEVDVNTDINYSGGTNAIDIQLVINAALGLSIDQDGDGLADSAETNLGSLLDNVESDGDGVDDGVEVVERGTDPADASKWLRTHGGGVDDRAYSIRPTSDGGFILAGLTSSSGAGMRDAYVVKVDQYGDVEWEQTQGGTQNDEAFTAVEAVDGSFVAVGYTESFGAGGKDMFLFRITSDGQRGWYRTFGGSFDDCGYGLLAAAGGGFVLCGYTRSFGAGQRDFYVVQTDAAGQNPQSNTFGGPRDEIGYAAIEISGGFVIVGSSDYGNYTVPATGLDVYLVKTDLSGTDSFALIDAFDAGGDDVGVSIDVASDGGFAVGGFSIDADSGNRDIYLLRTDSDANVAWENLLGADGDDLANGVLVTTGDAIIVTGYSDSYGAGDRDGYLAKTDDGGTLLWQRQFGGNQDDNLYGAAVESNGGGFVVAGLTQSYGDPIPKVFLLGTDDEGNNAYSTGKGGEGSVDIWAD